MQSPSFFFFSTCYHVPLCVVSALICSPLPPSSPQLRAQLAAERRKNVQLAQQMETLRLAVASGAAARPGEGGEGAAEGGGEDGVAVGDVAVALPSSGGFSDISHLAATSGVDRDMLSRFEARDAQNRR